jgi:phage protein D/phage baseplate assembly protein gpV
MISLDSAKNQNRPTDTVTTIVKVDNTDVTSSIGGLMSFYVYHEINKIPTATLHFSDGSVEKGAFSKCDGDDFTPGKTLEIQMGYRQKDLKTIFKGIITKQQVKVLSGRPYHLEVECKDPSVKLTLSSKSKYYYKQSDDAVIQEIVRGYNGIKPGEIEKVNYKHEELVQYHCTDWDFIVKRADANGLYVYPNGGKLDVKKPKVKGTPDLEVQFGIGNAGIPVIEYEAALDVQDHYPGVDGTTWDNAKQELMKEQAGKAGGGGGLSKIGNSVSNAVGSTFPSLGNKAERYFPDVLYDQQVIHLFHGGNKPTEEIQAWVAAKQQRGELSRVKGRARIRGIEVFPGQTLGILGGGDRFNGQHFITGVFHQLVNGAWQTDIQFGWRTRFFAESIKSGAMDAGGLVGGIRGLHVAKVTKVQGDDLASANRIQVSLPLVAQNENGTQGKGIWARVANLNARDGKGMVFRPEKGDEVIVGFINNDPNDVIVLGSLYSPKQKAPSVFEPKDKDAVKGFISNQGLQLIFDEEKKTITIKAGDGGDAPMIEMNGQSGSIKISAGSSASLELSSGNTTIKGTRIDLN